MYGSSTCSKALNTEIKDTGFCSSKLTNAFVAWSRRVLFVLDNTHAKLWAVNLAVSASVFFDMSGDHAQSISLLIGKATL